MQENLPLFLAPPWLRWQNKILFTIKHQPFLSNIRFEVEIIGLGSRTCYKHLNAQSEIVKALNLTSKFVPVDPQMSQKEEGQLAHWACPKVTKPTDYKNVSQCDQPVYRSILQSWHAQKYLNRSECLLMPMSRVFFLASSTIQFSLFSAILECTCLHSVIMISGELVFSWGFIATCFLSSD